MPVSEVQQYLSEKQEILANHHQWGGSGKALAASICMMIEDAVSRLYDENVASLSESDRKRVQSGLAIVACAGFGRRDPAPNSDVDALFLLGSDSDEVVLAFCKKLVRDIWDVGLSLGQNVSTIEQSLKLAQKDIIPATSLLESRFLLGHRPLFDDFWLEYDAYLRKGGGPRIYQDSIQNIRVDQQRYGSTTHLLEPDVKRSAGGLREVHLLRWIGRALFGTADPRELEEKGVLAAGDAEKVDDAYDFLLRVRADLHFQTKTVGDSLTRHEQVRIAKAWGYVSSPAILAVEQFMRDYFRKTTTLAEIVDRFVEEVRPRNLLRSISDLVRTRRIEDGIWLSPTAVGTTDNKRAEIVGSLEKTIHLAELAALSHVDIDHDTVSALRCAYLANPDVCNLDVDLHGQPLSQETVKRFMSLLSRPGGQGKVLRRLHQVGVLERIIPEFEHARCLLQFNAFHKYTVDEHTFVMLEFAEELQQKEGLLGEAYRKVARKDLLHLAILLHDLGKGFDEDHSVVGERIAERTGRRFSLSEQESKTIMYLVRQHLYMSTVAFHRDVTDKKLLVQFTRNVGSVEILRMLYVLTSVDTMAVGPGTYNAWRADVLNRLFQVSVRLLGDGYSAEQMYARAESQRQKLLQQYAADPRVRDYVRYLPNDYLSNTPEPEVVEHLLRWQCFTPDKIAIVNTEYRASSGTVFYTFVSNERITDNIFTKITGALTAHQLEILSARIRTLHDGTVFDEFEVLDKHHSGPPSADRCVQIGNTVRRVLAGELSVEDILWSSRSSLFSQKKRVLAHDSIRVVVDNDSSETCTVIDVFAANRRGLLYTLCKGISRLGLNIRLAKIATYDDEVVDVFYVQEFDSKKANREDRIKMIKDHLKNDVLRLATDPRSMGF